MRRESYFIFFASRPANLCVAIFVVAVVVIVAWPLHSVLLLTDSDYYRCETDKYFLHKLMNVQQRAHVPSK